MQATKNVSYPEDWFEAPENYPEAYRVNVQSQVDIAKHCEEHQIHCTLISSGFIFNYDDAHPVGVGFKVISFCNFVIDHLGRRRTKL